MARPVVPRSYAAWKPRLACDVTQILSCETVPRTMVQADRHSPSMMTVSPEVRMASYRSRYFPIRPPRSPAIRPAGRLQEVSDWNVSLHGSNTLMEEDMTDTAEAPITHPEEMRAGFDLQIGKNINLKGSGR